MISTNNRIVPLEDRTMLSMKKLFNPSFIGIALFVLVIVIVGAIYQWYSTTWAASVNSSNAKFNPVIYKPFDTTINTRWLQGASSKPLATITVNSLEDSATAGDGKCTLREAITNANADGETTGGDCAAGAGADTITFSVTGTINLTSELPTITSDMTISGPGPGLLEVHRNTAAQYRIFTINSPSTVSITGLKITDGNSPPGDNGGGVLNQGTLSLGNCVITGNTSDSFGGGV